MRSTQTLLGEVRCVDRATTWTLCGYLEHTRNTPAALSLHGLTRVCVNMRTCTLACACPHLFSARRKRGT
jgi:hypothetical protein